MDLSNNRIANIDANAFKEVGNALKKLKMSNALYFRQLPNMAFQSLSAMEVLDLSDNHIRTIPLNSFHKMSQLMFLYLQVSEILAPLCKWKWNYVTKFKYAIQNGPLQMF